jgi:oligopeptide transport system permease protein
MDESPRLTEADFITIGTSGENAEAIVRPSISFWSDVRRRIRKNRVAMGSLICVLLIAFGAIIFPLVSPYGYNDTDLSAVNMGPTADHWFGTDTVGRDLWTRVWIGARVSLVVGVAGAILPAIIGIIVGGISGYFGGVLDMVIMRVVDVLMCIPSMIYIILIMLYFGSGALPIIIAFAITGWMGSARSTRALVLQLKVREFVLAARVLGASPGRIIFRHLIPNTLGYVVVGITMSIPGAIFHEAFLSYIGLGVRPPMTSWGQLAQMGSAVYRVHPYQLLFPALFISIAMLSFNLFGDGLRDALDPRLRD